LVEEDDFLVSLCKVADRAARGVIFNRLKKSDIAELDITVEVVSEQPLTVNVEVGIALSPSVKEVDVNVLTKEATEKALEAIKRFVSSTKERIKS
jgi:hypothetical protein